MKTVKYGVEITFPDYEVLDADIIQEILFHHPTLKDCLVNVYLDYAQEFRCEICGKEITDPSYEVALDIYGNPPIPNQYDLVYIHSECNRYEKFHYFKDSEYLIRKGEKSE